MSNVYRESVNLKIQNRHVVVGVTAVEVNPFGFQFVKGILLRAPGTLDPVPNTTTVWIGNANITANTAVETGGFPIIPGASLFIPVEFVEGLYAIASAVDQNLAWLGV